MMRCAHMLHLAIAICLAALGLSLLTQSPTMASACGSGGAGGDDFVSVFVHCQRPPATGDVAVGKDTPASSAEQHTAYLRYLWHSPCFPFAPNHQAGDAPDCLIARSCPDPGARSWQLWALSADTRSWVYLLSQCFAGVKPPTPAQTPVPQVTPGLVLNALRQIGLPSLRAHTQPKDKTLVNFATIFYTEPQTFARTLTLLGQQVPVEATPTSFAWHYGDGTGSTTSSPGAPYPSKDITHDYVDAHVTVAPSVDLTYSARFRVGNGPWQQIPETVTIAGPPSALRISEATPVLSGNYPQ